MGLFDFFFKKDDSSENINEQIKNIFKKSEITYKDIKLIISHTIAYKGNDKYTTSCGHLGYQYRDFARKYKNATRKNIVEKGSLFSCHSYKNGSVSVNIYIPKDNRKVAYVYHNKNYYRFEFTKNLR